MSEPKRQRCQRCKKWLLLKRFGFHGAQKNIRHVKCKRCLADLEGQEKRYAPYDVDMAMRGLRLTGRDY